MNSPRSTEPRMITADTAESLMSMLAKSGCYVPDAAGVDCINPQRTVVAVLAQQLVTVVASRLAIMPEVAYIKYLNNLPIDDPARESALVDGFVAHAVQGGVPAQVARCVITAQLEAAKHVQYELFFQWLSGTRPQPDHQPMPLADLRERVDQATTSLLQLLINMYCAQLPEDWASQLSTVSSHARTSLNDVPNTAFNSAVAPLRTLAAH